MPAPDPDTAEFINCAIAFFILGAITAGLIVYAVMYDGRIQIEPEPTEHGGRPL